MAEELEYRPLELYHAGGDMSVSWYFVLYFRHPVTQKMERLKPTFNINRLKSKQDRYAYAKKVIRRINTKLKKGEINPFTKRNLTLAPSRVLISEVENINDKHVNKMSEETKKSYKTHINRFRDFLDDKEMMTVSPEDFDANLAQDFQLYFQEDKELANPTVNANVGRMRNYFDTLRKKRMVIVNPFQDVDSLPERRSFKYVPYSEDEKKAIAKKLKRDSPSLYLLSQIIYSFFARPKEICSLTRADFDFSKDTKYLILKHSTIKNNRTSYHQVMTPLYNLLLEMGIDRYPMNRRIFADIVGDSHIPELQRKAVTYQWHRLIIEGLGIDNNLYALKHTGNCDHIIMNPNYDLLWLKQQNGHASLEQTQAYIRDLPIRRLIESNVNVSLFGC
ncbi:tyrosine-type recombinase/integrase [Chitinophaga filiformis]|uniref:Site-specific recombinase XerD n=1 Tax=Chitinophaga filiformis TaxID=104663 RepID=A0A1G7Y4A2_CHIFI|nr:site-specific integrase [Chitinophaga filiformis]SDG91244.1 Site-specific recombinase XerD [Chitinophaga filiformis]